jgi:p-cumate 2,3-dioxygenase subunit beta
LIEERIMFMPNQFLLTRLQIEDVIYREAELLDQWKLDEWLAIYTANCRYEIGPTGKADAAQLSPETSLFLVADDRFRLEQRLIRLKKPTAHAEYPRSRSRHLYTNVRVKEDDSAIVKALANFSTFRSAKHVVQHFFGQLHYTFETNGGGEERSYRIARKRVILDLDSLIPQGKVTIIL